MNLWIKYGPLLYTFFTRCWLGKHKLINFIYYLRMNIGIRTIPLFIILIQGKTSFIGFIISILLYVYIFLDFLVFYEVGYLSNDLMSKKEKNGIMHIEEKVDDKFIKQQIVVRIIVGIVLLFPLYFISLDVLKYLLLILGIMLIIFFVHNCIRNYFYNFFTIFFLRFSKFILFILPVYFLTGTFVGHEIRETIIVYLLYGHLITINHYDIRLGGKRGLPYCLLQYGYLTICVLILFLVNNSILYLAYFILYLAYFIIQSLKENINKFRR